MICPEELFLQKKKKKDLMKYFVLLWATEILTLAKDLTIWHYIGDYSSLEDLDTMWTCM